MFMKRLIVFTVIALALSSTTFAQGEFLRPGESGFGTTGGLSSGERLDGEEVSIGANIGGKVDIAYSYSNNTDIHLKSHAGSITYYLKFSHAKSLFGVGLTAGYMSTKYSWSYYGRYFSSDYRSALIGITVFDNIYASENVLIQPSLSSLFAIRTDDTFDRAQGSIQGRLALCLFHHSPVRPFVSIGAVLPDSRNTEIYATVSGGVVVAI